MPIWGKKKTRDEVGLSDTTIWRLEKKGGFPKRIQLSPGRVGWNSEAIKNWIKARPVVEEDSNVPV